MALKKSDLCSSFWASCDELRGGMDAIAEVLTEMDAELAALEQREKTVPLSRP